MPIKIIIIHSIDSVAAHKQFNFMTVHKLALVWCPYIFRPYYAIDRNTHVAVDLLKLLIENYKVLLSDSGVVIAQARNTQ